MKNSNLNIYAGTTARRHLELNGLRPTDVKHMLAASGGPKWMVLFGLDQFLNQEFFSPTQTLNIMGSSAGAMRACCYGQKDPAAAIQRFADAYTHTRYERKPSAKDITDSAHVLLQQLFGKNGQAEVLSNQHRQINIVTARCHGLASQEHSLLQGMGMLSGFALNRLSRRLLDIPFERVIFFNGQPIHFHEQHALRTRYISLHENNLYLAALASGSIPMVMQGIFNIPGAPAGCYRDGGIVDYHFDVDLGDGLCLYPHFNNHPRPAWFDKFGTRKINSKHYHNTLLLAPSESFIASLPYGKIPDRKDFADMDDKQRESFWRQVQSESQRLADEFHERCIKQDWSDIKTIEMLG
jgi:hypothetical protein